MISTLWDKRNRSKSARAVIAIFAAAVSTSVYADGVTFTPYGRVKLDGVYDSQAMFPGDFTVETKVQPTNGASTDEYTMTANQSIFGIDMAGPSVAGATLTGKIELDFYSPGTTQDNRAIPQMKQAYMKLDWADSKFSILAGQTWDLIQSLNLVDLNYGYLFLAGNPGYRRPQILVSKGFDIGSSELKVQASINKPTPAVLVGDATVGQASAADSDSPSFQGRISYTTHLLTDKPTVISIKGSKANARIYDSMVNGSPNAAGAHFDGVNQWSWGADLSLPIMDNLKFAGGYFRGADMNDFFGLSQAFYNNGTLIEQEEEGAWGELSYQVNDNVWVAAGYGYDAITDPWDNTAGNVELLKNNVPFALATYNFTKEFKVGFEVSQYISTYSSGATVGSQYQGNRYQLSTMLNF